MIPRDQRAVAVWVCREGIVDLAQAGLKFRLFAKVGSHSGDWAEDPGPSGRGFGPGKAGLLQPLGKSTRSRSRCSARTLVAMRLARLSRSRAVFWRWTFGVCLGERVGEFYLQVQSVAHRKSRDAGELVI